MRRLGLALAMGAALAIAPAARAVELEGTWYVLVHYQDADTNKPDQWRWDDRVWSFAKKGERLEWTEWPILVLDDERGRFEAQRGGRAARVLGAWEPDASQLADIQDGVQVNTRGSKTKTLRAEEGGTRWSSGEGAGADSAMVITYSETWTIEGLPGAPTFTRDDSMGGASAETMEGRTQYRGDAIQANGDEIVGAYDRDGTRKGRFRMIRSGGVEGMKQAAKTQEDLQRKTFLRTMATSEEMRQVVRERVQQDLAARGVTADAKEIEKLTEQSIQAAIRSGSADGAQETYTKQATQLFYSFATTDAKHDASARYGLPFGPNVPRQLGQGVGGDMGIDLYGNPISSSGSDPATHVGKRKYGFDWAMPKGTKIVAARDGEVARVVDGFTTSGPQQGLASQTNAVFIKHDDGTWSEYTGLDAEIPVKPGQKVQRGDVIGACGATGSWRAGTGASSVGIHFAVGRLDADGEPETVDIRFDDGSAQGFVPTPGSYYGAPSGKASKADPPPDAATPRAE